MFSKAKVLLLFISLFNNPHIVCGGSVFRSCFVMHHSMFEFCNHRVGEERAG